MQKHMAEIHEINPTAGLENTNCVNDNSMVEENRLLSEYPDFSRKKIKKDAAEREITACENPKNYEIFEQEMCSRVKNQELVEKHSELFVCFVKGCLKGFSTKYNLQVHMKSFHMKIKSFQCEFPSCGSKFSHKASLKRHCLKAHGGQTSNSASLLGNLGMGVETLTLGCREESHKADDIHVFIDNSNPLEGILPIKPDELNNL